MWRDYSIRYIKENKSTSITLATMTFLATMFLSLITALAYNIYIDTIIRTSITSNGKPVEVSASMIAYGFVILVLCLSLIMMLHNAFAIGMSNRIHQLGILQSVGATPKQIRSFLFQEAAILSAIPSLAGIFTGILICYGVMQFLISVGKRAGTKDIEGYTVMFRYHIWVFMIVVLLCVLTIVISIRVPVRKLSRLSPITAIFNSNETQTDKMKRFRLSSKVFGVYGELAKKSIYARQKALRITSVSLALSFLSLISFLNIETLSGISTKQTYFERFHDVWDMMLTLDANEINDSITNQIRNINGVENCITYQKLETDILITDELISDECKSVGLNRLNNEILKDENENYRLPMYIYVIDDESFLTYCKKQKINSNEGAVVLNLIWDSLNSKFSDRKYIPLFSNIDQLTAEKTGNINIIGFSEKLPDIKESMEQNAVSIIMSKEYYDSLSAELQADDCYYNIHLLNQANESEIKEIINENLAGNEYKLQSRTEDEAYDIKIRLALKILVLVIALLISSVGIVNVFSSVLGQIYQRQKEFARYFSIGISRHGMIKILAYEALFIGLKPLLISLTFNIPVVLLAANAADISLTEFLKAAPYMIVILFSLFVYFIIGLAYYLGGTKICKADIVEILKDEAI